MDRSSLAARLADGGFRIHSSCSSGAGASQRWARQRSGRDRSSAAQAGDRVGYTLAGRGEPRHPAELGLDPGIGALRRPRHGADRIGTGDEACEPGRDAARRAPSEAARRLATLAEIWADDGVYVDPDVPEGVQGREALSEQIALSHAELPDLAITATTEVAVLGDRAWYRWSATAENEEPFTGTDFLEFAPDGRIARVTNFFDD